MDAPLKTDKKVRRSLKKKKKLERRIKLNNDGIKEEKGERRTPTHRRKNEYDFLDIGNVVGNIYTRNLRMRSVPMRFYNEDADDDLYIEIGPEGNSIKAEDGIESNSIIDQPVKVEVENDPEIGNSPEVSDDRPLLEPPVVSDDQPIFNHSVIIPNGDYQAEKLPESFANIPGQQLYEMNSRPIVAETSHFQDYQRILPNVSEYDVTPTTTCDEPRSIYSPIGYIYSNVKINSPEENIQGYGITPSTSFADPRSSSLPFRAHNPNIQVNLTGENVQGLLNNSYYQGNNIEEQPQDLRVHLDLDSSEPRNAVVDEGTTQTIVSNQPSHNFISQMQDTPSYELSISTVDTTTKRYGPAYKDLPDTEHRRYYVYAYSEFGHPERERKYVENYKFDRDFEDIISDFRFSQP